MYKKKVGIVRGLDSLLITLILITLILIGLSLMVGCSAGFTGDGLLQWNLSETVEPPQLLLAEFEASDTAGVAGDVTEKSGSSCAGGICTIY